VGIRAKLLILLAILCLATSAAAQFTLVSGTITDPNGLPYANGTINPVLVISGTPIITATNSPYTPPTGPIGLDATGSFTVQLANRASLTPGLSTWSFIVNCGAGCVPPAGGKGAVSFTLTGVILAGATQSLSVALQAAAPALATASAGTLQFAGVPSGSCSPGQTAVNNTNGNFYYCNAGTFSQISAAAGATAFSSVTAGTNTLPLVVGTGGSLTTSGTGTITATALPWTGLTSLPAGCTNQAITAILAVPTCSTITAAFTNNTIAQTGVDINTSFQVTALHLASPLGTASGGTGLATWTAHAFAIGEGASSPAFLGPGTANQIPSSSGVALDPAYKSLADLGNTLYFQGSGVAQGQTVALAPPATALTPGLLVGWRPSLSNTGPNPSLTVNALATTNITKCGATALVANDILVNTVAYAVYDGTQFELLNPQAVGCGAGVLSAGATINPGLTGNAVKTCNTDGTIFANAAACTNYAIANSLLGLTINDSTPADVTVDLFSKNANVSGLGVLWNLGVGKPGTNPSTANPICWIIEVPQILNASADIKGVGGVTWNGDCSSGSMIMSGTNFPGYLSNGSPTAITTVAFGAGVVTLTAAANFPSAFVNGSPLLHVTGCNQVGDNGYFTIASGGAGSTTLTYNDASGVAGATGCIAYIDWTGKALGTVTCNPTGGALSNGTYYVQLVEENNLRGAYTSAKPVAGPTIGSNEVAVTCSNGGAVQSLSGASPPTLVNPNKLAIGSAVFDGQDYAVCASATSGQEVCGCTFQTANSTCTGVPVVTTPGTLGTVDLDAGIQLGSSWVVTAMPSLPKSGAGTGGFAVPKTDMSSVMLVLGDTNNSHVGSSNSFGQTLDGFAIQAGPVAGSNTLNVANPSVMLWARTAQESFGAKQLMFAGPANVMILQTRGNSMFSNLLPQSNTWCPIGTLPLQACYNLLIDGWFFNASSDADFYASSFNNGGVLGGNHPANVYVRGYNTFLNEFGIHHENALVPGGNNIVVDWFANASIFGGIGSDKSAVGLSQLHRCAQSNNNPYFPVAGATAAEVNNLVTMTAPGGGKWGPSLTNHGGFGSRVLIQGCTVAGYNISANIVSGGSNQTTFTYNDDNSGLGAATTCTVSSEDCQGNAGVVNEVGFSPQGGGVTVVQDDLRNLQISTLGADKPAYGATYDSQNYVAKASLIVDQNAIVSGFTAIGASGTGNLPCAFGVEPNVNYRLIADIAFTPSANTTGLNVEVTGPASPILVSNLLEVSNITSVLTAPTLWSSGYSAAVTSGTASISGLNTAHFESLIQGGTVGGTVTLLDGPNGAGTLINKAGTRCYLYPEIQLP